MKPLSHSMQHEQRPLYIVWLWNWNKIYENLGSLSGRVMGRCDVARWTAGAKFEVVRQIAWAVVPNGNEIKIHWIDFQFFYIAQTAFERCERTKRRWQKRNCVHNVHLKRTRAMKQTNKQNPSCTNLLLLRMIHLRSHRPAKRKKKILEFILFIPITEIKSNLLLLQIEYLLVVQYGETGRWSLLEIRVR